MHFHPRGRCFASAKCSNKPPLRLNGDPFITLVVQHKSRNRTPLIEASHWIKSIDAGWIIEFATAKRVKVSDRAFKCRRAETMRGKQAKDRCHAARAHSANRALIGVKTTKCLDRVDDAIDFSRHPFNNLKRAWRCLQLGARPFPVTRKINRD